MRDEQRASDLKELQVHVEANLSTRAGARFSKISQKLFRI